MKRIHSRLGLFLACALVFFVAGCGEGQDGPAEKAGKAIDGAIQKGTDSVNEAVGNTGDAIKEAGEAGKEAVGLKD